MSRYLLLSFVAAAIGVQGSLASAQSVTMGQGCGNVQSYQRYSYQPSAAPASPVATNQPSVTTQSAPVVAEATVQPQTYRRYSYQPQARSSSYSASSRKPVWEYAKGDPRRYRP